MCCVVSTLLLLGPRLAILVWWWLNPVRIAAAFGAETWPLHLSFPVWVWPLLGLLILPWTTLAYLVVFPGGVVGLDWLWLAVGLLVDLGSHSGGGREYRHRRSRRRS